MLNKHIKTEYEMTKYNNSLVKKNKEIIFAIDNDECIGSWADLSMIYLMLKQESLELELNINLFVDIIIKTNCVRPYVKLLFDKLIEMKKQGLIHQIIMFTAAPNNKGWVSFLSKVIEKWYGQPIYDNIIYQEMIEEWHFENKTISINETGYIKNMHLIHKKYHPEKQIENLCFIAIDDRPENIINGIKIGVNPYKVALNLIEIIRMYFPTLFEYLFNKYSISLLEPWNEYIKFPKLFSDYNNDKDFLFIVDNIDKIISEQL